MIITTSQQRTLANCCPCSLPECPAPTLEERDPCGYLLGSGSFPGYFSYTYATDGTPTPELASITYKKVTVTKSVTSTDPSGSATYTRIFERARNEETGTCDTTATGSASWSLSGTEEYPEGPPEGRHLTGFSQSGTCGDGLDSCGGTYTSTYSEDPTSETSDTGGLDIAVDSTDVSSEWTAATWLQTFTNGSLSIVYEEPTQGDYRFVIPEDFTTEEVPRTTYNVEWDEIFFPAPWEEWKALKDAFDAATAEHELWENADPDTRGEEPEVPEDPGPAPEPAPSLMIARSWEWDGNPEELRSDWYEYEILEMEGETRICNLRVTCFKAAAIGVAPTAHGEIYEL